MTTTHVALASGGMDSAVAAHVAVRWGPADILVYLDTRTGLEANREYVEELADHLGVQCWTLRTHEQYEEAVREHGFPGPSRHSIMYRRLKERQIQKLAAVSGGELHCWTGVRAAESDRRFRHVEPQSTHDGGRWYWHAPIHDWTKDDCERYLDEFGLPRNDLWTALGRSGDCYCGAFGNRMELLDLDAIDADRAEWLRNLEAEVEDDEGRDEWAWHDDRKHVADAIEDDDQPMLCSSCAVAYPDGRQNSETDS